MPQLAKDNDGWTPLHWAARTGDLAVVKKLIEVSAMDAKKKDSIKRWTPRQIASYNDHSEIIGLLEPFSIHDEILPRAGKSKNIICDGCNCFTRGISFRCKSCYNFNFCEKCMVTRDLTHPTHEFDKIHLEGYMRFSGKSLINEKASIHDENSLRVEMNPGGQRYNNALEDYQMQRMLFEQRKKKRTMLARQKQMLTQSPDDAPAGADTPLKSDAGESVEVSP
ncbi:hypothetical protein DSL72_006330 [Monilinia vaccinii-corymbosi]|uniref:ZZ-type domain-containing protein n=1 Tax=Monilinia vaccinii-corymbosi TaxID=61207 RepID=A0A8A3PNJ3_9HELO|nr:hypothetical protein DSL72_006330 [Monilinia vaccinii-corymbosi]